MKKSLYFLFVLVNQFANSQHINFTYDASGNRYQRNYSIVRMANPTQEKDSSSFIESNFGIKVFPNPASEDINVFIAALKEGESAILQLSDEQGKILSEKTQKSQQEVLRISGFKPGIYYLKIFIKGKIVSYKIVKL